MLKGHLAHLAQMDIASGAWSHTICPTGPEEQTGFTLVVVCVFIVGEEVDNGSCPFQLFLWGMLGSRTVQRILVYS